MNLIRVGNFIFDICKVNYAYLEEEEKNVVLCFEGGVKTSVRHKTLESAERTMCFILSQNA
jgi:hypothetical protein